jgi:hypothetical protein
MLDGAPGPKRGDWIKAIGKKGVGAQYRVLTSRQVKRRDPIARHRAAGAGERARDKQKRRKQDCIKLFARRFLLKTTQQGARVSLVSAHQEEAQLR